MEFWGQPTDIEQTAHAIYNASFGGTIPTQLIAWAGTKGFTAKPISGSVGAIKNAIDRGIPPIIMVRITGKIFHYLVVIGYSEGDAVIVCLDYAGRRRLIEYLELERFWMPAKYEMILVTRGTATSEFELGVAAEDAGHIPKAVDHYRKAIALDARHVDARFGLGNCLKKLGRPDEARKTYEDALELAPSDPKLLNNLADLILKRSNDADRAEVLAGRAVDILTQQRTRIRKKLILAQDSRRRKSLQSQERMVELRLAYTLGTLGQARFRNGKHALAAASWEASLRHFPLTRPDSRARRMLDLGRANRKLGMNSIARESLRKALGEARDPKLRAEIEAEIR